MPNTAPAGSEQDRYDEWKLSHAAPANDGYNRPLHDPVGIWPEDVYEHPEYYVSFAVGGSNDEAREWSREYTRCQRESFEIMRQVRGRPDAAVTVYRAVPEEYRDRGIQPGDWVTTSRGYAEIHGHGMRPNGGDWPVVERIVTAAQLFTEANEFCEYGYDPTANHQHQQVRIAL